MSYRPSLPELLDPRITSVVVVDPQNDFFDPTEFPAAVAMRPRLLRFLEDVRNAGVFIVVTQTIYGPKYDTPVWLSRRDSRPHRQGKCTEGTPGAELAPGFRPRESEYLIVKHRYSAFFGTELETVLRVRDIQTLILTGISTDVCVESTARDAFQRDFWTVILSDCTASYTETGHRATLDACARQFGTVLTSSDVAGAWRSAMIPVRS